MVASYAHTQLWGDSIEKIMTPDLATVPPTFPAGLFLVIFVLLCFTGAGAYSLDGSGEKETPKAKRG
mgnify:CR=1 FL=1